MAGLSLEVNLGFCFVTSLVFKGIFLGELSGALLGVALLLVELVI